MALDTKLHRHKRRYTIGDALVTALLTLLALLIFVPFYNALIISVQTGRAHVLNPVALFPTEFTLENYRIILKSGFIQTGYRNTLLVTVGGTLFSMAIMVMMAYAFSRKAFPGKKPLFMLTLFTMFFSGGMVPTYLMMRDMGLINNLLSIILLGGIGAYYIIIMKTGFEQTPEALEEAGRIDGASDLRIFISIMLPLQGPILATFTLFTLVTYWNSWFWPLLLINSADKMTLQVILRAIISEMDFSDTDSTEVMLAYDQGVKMAAVVLTMLPIMLVYPFLQKHFAKGVMIGAIKM
jgi:ABC-type sugar transport system, permease component